MGVGSGIPQGVGSGIPQRVGSGIPQGVGGERKGDELCNIAQYYTIENMQTDGSQQIQGGNRDKRVQETGGFNLPVPPHILFPASPTMNRLKTVCYFDYHCYLTWFIR